MKKRAAKRYIPFSVCSAKRRNKRIIGRNMKDEKEIYYPELRARRKIRQSVWLSGARGDYIKSVKTISVSIKRI